MTVEIDYYIDEDEFYEKSKDSDYWGSAYDFYQDIKDRDVDSLTERQLEWLERIYDAFN